MGRKKKYKTEEELKNANRKKALEYYHRNKKELNRKKMEKYYEEKKRREMGEGVS
jgi:hypothetical protein